MTYLGRPKFEFCRSKMHLVYDERLSLGGERVFRMRAWFHGDKKPVVLVSQIPGGVPATYSATRIANKVWREVAGYNADGMILYLSECENHRLLFAAFDWIGHNPQRQSIRNARLSPSQWQEIDDCVGSVVDRGPGEFSGM